MITIEQFLKGNDFHKGASKIDFVPYQKILTNDKIYIYVYVDNKIHIWSLNNYSPKTITIISKMIEELFKKRVAFI